MTRSTVDVELCASLWFVDYLGMVGVVVVLLS